MRSRIQINWASVNKADFEKHIWLTTKKIDGFLSLQIELIIFK